MLKWVNNSAVTPFGVVTIVDEPDNSGYSVTYPNGKGRLRYQTLDKAKEGARSNLSEMATKLKELTES